MGRLTTWQDPLDLHVTNGPGIIHIDTNGYYQKALDTLLRYKGAKSLGTVDVKWPGWTATYIKLQVKKLRQAYKILRKWVRF